MEPTLELHIERLVLHGVALRDRDRVGAALQVELSRLLTERGIPSRLSNSGALAELKVDGRSLAAGGSAEGMGVQIAQAIYGGLAPQSRYDETALASSDGERNQSSATHRSR